jgi:hypothetical protein
MAHFFVKSSVPRSPYVYVRFACGTRFFLNYAHENTPSEVIT